ncbi:hypothetical protein ZYGR_0AF03470 [Zygosaccharomyces rouxii]|uniref:Uncharacterized protein n=1 Tax=Zygosaccharomyces rouxii TaxID=4956 RepID=A0A1Q3A7Z7_ZYGRO|nr:hypothetical protein ZYGR_0AF03470 [Zygosaccharomyces rouxii]
MDQYTRVVNDPVFSELTLEVARFPRSLEGWEKLLNHLTTMASPLNKNIDPRLYQLIISTYDSLLCQFRYLENYYVDYALLEYRLGHLSKMHRIFQHGLAVFNDKSLLLWVSYLKICNEVIPNSKQLLEKYELAEDHVGMHFFAGEFWQMYLEQVRLRCNHQQRFFSMLRKILEIPLYSFSHFYALWLRCVDDIQDVSQLKKLAPKEDLVKKLKIDIDAGGRKGPRLQEAKKLLRKFTRELYLVVQYQVLEIYSLYESKIQTRYYVSPETLIPAHELELWQKYLEYTVNLRIDDLTHLNFQRALLPLAHYDVIWIQYARWLVDWKEDLLTAKQVLTQGILLSLKKSKLLKILYTILCSLNEFDQLQWIINHVKAAYSNRIEETDDFELFWDYIHFQLFIQAQSDDVLDIISKRLDQCQAREGQFLLLSALLQLQQTDNTSFIEDKIFQHLIEQNRDYYLNDGRFWSLYSRLIYLDSNRSYLERRKYILGQVWTKSRERPTKNEILPHLQQFCQSYLPEDIDNLEDLFQ